VQVQGKVFRVGVLSAKGKESTFKFNVPWKVEKLILNHLEDTIAVIR
jgi:hypothetical protein